MTRALGLPDPEAVRKVPATVIIIVIEDHALMRDLLLKACGEAMPGSIVLGAKDAETGLTLCRVRQPDVIILDLALPDRHGLDVLDDLIAACQKTKVIGISGYSDEYTLHRAMHSKLHGFVDKNEQKSTLWRSRSVPCAPANAISPPG